MEENLYNILGIEKEKRDCPSTDIKKAYKRQSLRYHPDKAGDSVEAREKYEQITRAYQILSDDRQRKIYDKYGEKGLAALGRLPAFMDPEVLPGLKYLFLLLFLIVFLATLFPSFLAAHVDLGFSSWTVAFSPLFILFGIIWMALFLAVFKPRREEEANEEDGNKTRLPQVLALCYWSLPMLFIILLPLQLDQTISISWWLLIIPIFIMESINLVMISYVVLGSIYDEGAASSRTFKEIIIILFNNLEFFLIRLSQLILIILKVTSAITNDWAVVFLPVWVFGFLELLKSILNFFSNRQLREGEPGPAGKFFVFAIWATIIFSFFGLLVKRLENSASIQLAIVFIPLFVLLGLLLLTLCCCLPLLSFGQDDFVDQELASAPNPLNPNQEGRNSSITVVALNRRIAPHPQDIQPPPNRQQCSIQ